MVVKTTGNLHEVKTAEGLYSCRLKGSFRMRGHRHTNPIAVGDEVEIETPLQSLPAIVSLLPRRNYIMRKAVNLSRETHILAANIDQVLLMFTLIHPVTPLEFLDRFLLTAEAYHIPSLLVLNKNELYGEELAGRKDEIFQMYEGAGYRIKSISVYNQTGLKELQSLLTNKFTLIAGNSGVGKTSLINALVPGLGLKTGTISSYHHTGKHTTTFPEMLSLPEGGYVIDTPGIRGFGIVDINPTETGLYFPEIFRLSKNCRFYNCTHLHEPHCAVKDALISGELHESRYRSYIKIFTGEPEKYRQE